MKPHFRKHYFLDKYVLISPPSVDTQPQIERLETLTPSPKGHCHYCPKNCNDLHDLLTLGPKQNWYVKVVKHHKGHLAPDNSNAFGHHEVIIDTPNHIAELEQLPAQHIAKLFEAFSHRVRTLRKQDPSLSLISLLKSQGGHHRHSLEHSHTHLLALDFLPPEINLLQQTVTAYKKHHNTCPYNDIICQEANSDRAVYEDKDLFIVAPYASEKNYELWVLFKNDITTLSDLGTAGRLQLAHAMKEILRGLSTLQVPYSFQIHELPKEYALPIMLKIVPEANIWPKADLGEVVPVNPVLPEMAARFYRSFIYS